ncbi:MAG: ribosome small subunit-dependent GTPase A [Lachnospiraceae bacterium]|nr:ribosome small subunit-dependent GTPase A [Lachnospiraceae bacterium]
MNGKIIKGIAGFYYVNTEKGIFECKAKGIFRKKGVKPLVGDMVEIDILDEEKLTGNLVNILERQNELIRPAVANVDQAIVIFAAAKPAPNLNLLDRFLITMQKHGVECVVCFNKQDIVKEHEIALLRDTYENCGYKVVCASAINNQGIDEINELLKNKTTVLAGPSGVGKSSIINMVTPEANVQTGNISDKIDRGKHTTRHSELFMIGHNTYIMDTPGFSSLYINDFEREELKSYFIEFNDYEGNCKFQGCIHINEPKCAVKDAVNQGKISKTRYDNYVLMYEELKDIKRY